MLFGREPRRQLDRREPRAVQDLVGVGVADSREDPRIGERALERVARGDQPRAKSASGSPRAPRDRPDRAAASAASPCTTYSAARLRVPASLSVSVPDENAKRRAVGRVRARAGRRSSAGVPRSSGAGPGRDRPRARAPRACPGAAPPRRAGPRLPRAADRRCAASAGPKTRTDSRVAPSTRRSRAST